MALLEERARDLDARGGENEAKVEQRTRARGLRWHYAWVVSGVTFLTLLVAAGVRTAPGVFIKPFEAEFGWSRGSISLAVSFSLLAYGLGGPLGGSLVDRFGPRRVMLLGLSLILLGLGPMLALTSLWQLYLLWGLITGLGTGAVSSVLGTSVADRWFLKHRGMVIGLFGAASSTGQLIFLPSLIGVTSSSGWRGGITLIVVAIAAVMIPVALLMRDQPEDMHLQPVGAGEPDVVKAQAAEGPSVSLRGATRTRDFWLLAGSFFICGYTSNGLVGTHLIPHALEHGFTEAAAAAAVGLMGMMNIFGTLTSGWLTDRYDNRRLLAAYYGFRALSLFWLPFVYDTGGLFLFAVLYGLDWIATVPPTANLTAQRFGRASYGRIFGWIYCAHMVGASLAAFAGGFFHDLLGDYTLVFISAALLGFIAVALSMSVTRQHYVKKAQSPVYN
ncbi:MAG: MFS transporter [Chloroflexia bacterium]